MAERCRFLFMRWWCVCCSFSLLVSVFCFSTSTWLSLNGWGLCLCFSLSLSLCFCEYFLFRLCLSLYLCYFKKGVYFWLSDYTSMFVKSMCLFKCFFYIFLRVYCYICTCFFLYFDLNGSISKMCMYRSFILSLSLSLSVISFT